MEPFNPFDIMRRNTRKVKRIRQQGNAGSGFQGFGEFLSAKAAGGGAPQGPPADSAFKPPRPFEIGQRQQDRSAVTPASFTAQSPARDYMNAMGQYEAGTGSPWGEWTPPAEPKTNPCEQCDPATQECRQVNGVYTCVTRQTTTPTTTCPAGQVWNPQAGRCETAPTVGVCSGGRQWINGECRCPAGTTLVNGTCQAPTTCPTGYTLNANGWCVYEYTPPPTTTCKANGDNCDNGAACCSGNCWRKQNDNQKKCHPNPS